MATLFSWLSNDVKKLLGIFYLCVSLNIYVYGLNNITTDAYLHMVNKLGNWSSIYCLDNCATVYVSMDMSPLQLCGRANNFALFVNRC